MGEIEVFEDTAKLTRALAERFISLARASIRERERFIVAIQGGGLSAALCEKLVSSDFSAKIEWGRVFLFVTDERGESYESPQSRFRDVCEALAGEGPLSASHIHGILAEADPFTAASRYEVELRNVLRHQGRFDLVILQLGKDGDVASLLPRHAALSEKERYVVAVVGERVRNAGADDEETGGNGLGYTTLTFAAINRARHVLCTATGPEVCGALKRLETGEQLPAALVKPEDGSLIWMADRSARFS